MRYNDPSGHCIGCAVAVLLLFAVLTSSCTTTTPVVYTPQEEYAAYLDEGYYQEAINMAVDVFGIDTTNVNGQPTYNPDITYPTVGETTPDRQVFLNNVDAESPILFASDIYHEVVHANQIASGSIQFDDNGNVIDQQALDLAEWEAYSLQYDFASRNGASGDDLRTILDRRDLIYNRMDDHTRDLIGQ